MERRLINANDPVLWRLSRMIDGYRYVPWEAFAEVPTAETVRYGRWEESRNIRGLSVCSCCGDAYPAYPTTYCPSCGAKMDGGISDAKK